METLLDMVIEVLVSPQSRAQRVIVDKAGMLKFYLKSPPKEGKANAELIDLVAKAVCLPKSKIAIILGKSSKRKRLKIGTEITFEKLIAKLGVERQLEIK